MLIERTPLVSILLLNYNGVRFASLWRSLFHVDYPHYEIIFIDNGSVDQSVNAFWSLTKEFPRISTQTVRIGVNVGYSKANNIGLNYASGKYIVLLSNDIEVSESWLRNMIRHLESDPKTAIAQSMMFSIRDRETPDMMWNYINVFGFNHRFVPSTLVKEVFYSEGAVMFFRKEIVREIGGLFDETYFMLDEDIDFCWRARLKGYKVAVVPDSIVFHMRGGTVKGAITKLEPRYVKTNARNRLSTLFKNYEASNVLKYLPVTFTLELFKGLWLFRRSKSKAGMACFSGIMAFVTSLPTLIHKRMFVQSMRSVRDKDIVRLMEGPLSAVRSLTYYSSVLERTDDAI